MRFCKRPEEVDAVQWDGDQFVGAAPEWAVRAVQTGAVRRIGPILVVGKGAGATVVERDDWLIRTNSGALMGYPAEIFAATYEAVE